MTDIIPFSFESKSIRVLNLDGISWFVAKDVAEALGYKDPTTAIKSHCRGVQKLHPLPTAGGKQEFRIILESNVYRLIIGSTLPEAERFERWLFEDVLPAIRKTGSYQMRPMPAPAPETVTMTKDEYIGLLKMQIEHLQAAVRPKHRGLSDEDKSRIKVLRAQGLGDAAIGKRIGRPKGTVGSYLRRVRLGAEG